MSVEKNEDNSKTEISGVGGWLRFLIILLMFIGPIGAIGITQDQMSTLEKQNPQLVQNQQYQNYKQSQWIIVSLAASICFVTGYKLKHYHVSSSVRFAILSIWGLYPFFFIVALTRDTYFSGEGLSYLTKKEVIQNSLVGLFNAVFWASVWTMYLKRSVRVKNTYFQCNEKPSSS